MLCCETRELEWVGGLRSTEVTRWGQKVIMEENHGCLIRKWGLGTHE